MSDDHKVIWRACKGNGSPIPHARIEVYATNPDGSRGKLLVEATADEDGAFQAGVFVNPAGEKKWADMSDAERVKALAAAINTICYRDRESGLVYGSYQEGTNLLKFAPALDDVVD